MKEKPVRRTKRWGRSAFSKQFSCSSGVFVVHFGLVDFSVLTGRWDCDFAERFFYIGPGGSFARDHSNTKLLDLIKEKGIRLSSMKRRTIWRGVAAFEHRAHGASDFII